MICLFPSDKERNLVIKSGRFGRFLACPGFPECKNNKPYFENTGVNCPKCGKEVLVKKTKKGRRYYGCENSPECDFMSWQKPSNEKCPKCGGDVVKGKFGAYCKNKCGMNVSRAMGAALTDSQVKSMLEGKKTLVKGLKGKKGSYDAYLIPEGIEDYSYTKDGKEVKGTQYKVKLEFPKKKK